MKTLHDFKEIFFFFFFWATLLIIWSFCLFFFCYLLVSFSLICLVMALLCYHIYAAYGTLYDKNNMSEHLALAIRLVNESGAFVVFHILCWDLKLSMMYTEAQGRSRLTFILLKSLRAKRIIKKPSPTRLNTLIDIYIYSSYAMPLWYYSKNVVRTYYEHEMLKLVVFEVCRKFQFFPHLGAQHDRRTNLGRYWWECTGTSVRIIWMLNDIIMTPVRTTRTQNKCNTIMTQLSKPIYWEKLLRRTQKKKNKKYKRWRSP